MKTFFASRLSSGNQFYRSKIIIDNKGITLTVPRFFGAYQNTIPFDNIASVYIISPFKGYSTIIVESEDATEISAKGFTVTEVETMKKLIQGKI